jgi:hypothetical protein
MWGCRIKTKKYKNMIKLIQVESVKFVELGNGDWLVDGVAISNDSYTKIKVKTVNEEVRKVTVNKVVDYYINGEDVKSTSDFETERSTLLKSYTGSVWDSIEDEFEYKKLNTYWKPIYKEIQIISEPYILEKVQRVVETNNPFITSMFANGEENDIFEYRKLEALKHTVNEVFTSLGFEFKEDCDTERTRNRKVWSNSAHSGIEFLKAFGGYITPSYKNIPAVRRGSLENLKKEYEKDVNDLKTIIENRNREHFGSFNAKRDDMENIVKQLRGLYNSLEVLDVKQKSYDDKRRLGTKVSDMINTINRHFEL